MQIMPVEYNLAKWCCGFSRKIWNNFKEDGDAITQMIAKRAATESKRHWNEYRQIGILSINSDDLIETGIQATLSNDRLSSRKESLYIIFWRSLIFSPSLW